MRRLPELVGLVFVSTALVVMLPSLCAQQPMDSPPRAEADELARSLAAGHSALEDERHDDAVAAFARASSLAPDRYDLRRALAGALSHRGVARAEHDPAAALADFVRADRLWPDNLAILVSLGSLHERVRDASSAEQAERAWRAVLTIDANEPRALAGMARLAVARDDSAAAAEYYARALQAEPGRSDYAEAAQRFARYAEVERDFVRLRHGMFELQYERGKAAGVDQALPVLRQWLSQAQRDLRLDLGRLPVRVVPIVCYARGQFARATSARHWASAYFDGKVRLDLGAWPEQRARIESELRHELAHAFLTELYPKLPGWLHEGYAQVIDGRDPALSRAILPDARRLTAQQLFGDEFLASDDVDFVRRGYAQAHLAVVTLRGMRTRREFALLLQRVASGTPSAEALRMTYRLDPAELASGASAGARAAPGR